ncbi:hypothetical protein DFS34DRAFT_76438 [Phlyctochytrium arcticum]|nr:hypothetical protein DFS34DRAFT_76438 [Phlyctochytrium arcticum]
MSGPPGRQNTNNGVYIPPRRNIPPRAARGGTSAGAGTNPNLGNVTAGPPLPTDVIRSATVGPPVSNPMAPRMSAGGPSVNIPSRGASAQGFPDRSASVLVNSSRTSFVPPPRRNLPSATATPPYPPRPNLQMPVPLGGFAESVQYSPSYSQQAGGYPPNQPYPTQSTYENPYLPPTATFPEPQYQTFASTTSEYQRRPHSFHDDQQVQIPPRRETQRYSFSETSSLSSLDDEPSRIPPRHASENSIYSGGPVIPPRSSGFMIPMRNTSVLKRNIDTLLDEGGMAFAAPRHNVDEALLKWRQARELAVKETDLLREAKALSNIGCALRSQGLLQESLNELRDAWDVSTRYVEESASRANSLWLQLVMRHADIDSDIEAEDTVTSSRVSSSKTTQDGPDASQGPPIVVWFLQLTTNLGNAYLCLGQHQEAIQYHDMCRRLAEAILEEYPLPPGFNLPNLHRRASSASIATATTTANSEPADTSKPASEVGPSTKTKIKLSYLHRQTLLAQCRSLTHLGLCHQQLGLDDEALNTHTQAESIVTFYSARLLSSTSTRRASLSSPSAIPTEVYAAEAAIVANVGTAYHAKTSIPMALEYHERALKLFRNIDDELGRAKEEANIGCLLIEAGRICNSMQWIREMELLDQSAIHLEQCKRYWGPPRLETINMGLGLPDEETPEVIGQPLFDHGIMALYEVQKVLQGSSDWIGTMFIYANLGMFSHSSQALHPDANSLSLQLSVTFFFINHTLHCTISPDA